MTETAQQATGNGTAQSAEGASAQSQTTQTQSETGQAGQQGASQSGNEGGKAERPAWLDEQFWDGEAGAIKSDDWSKHLSGMKEFVAAEQSRAAAVPETPDAYTAPEVLKLEGDLEFKVDADSPELGVWRKICHEAKGDQAMFEKGVAIYAQAQKQVIEAREAAIKENNAKLGPKAEERKAAVFDWMTARYGEQAADMKHFMVTAGQFEMMERVMRDVTTGGLPGFNGNGRDAGGKPRIDEAAWSSASYTRREQMLREANAR